MFKFIKLKKLVALVAATSLLSAMLPIVSLAFTNIVLLSETEVESQNYNLIVDTVGMPESGSVEYDREDSNTWESMGNDPEGLATRYFANSQVLSEGENLFSVRILDEQGEVIIENDFTVNYISQFPLISESLVSNSNVYNLKVGDDNVPFLGKMQYSIPGGLFSVWTDMVKDGGEFLASGIELNQGENIFELQIINLAEEVIAQGSLIVNYLPYDVILISETLVLESNYQLELKPVGYNLETTIIQYAVIDNEGSADTFWQELESTTAGTYIDNLDLALGENEIAVRLTKPQDQNNLDLYSGIVTINYDPEAELITEDPETDLVNCVHNDLNDDYEYCPAIIFNNEIGTFTGDGEGNFRAEDGVIRAEATKILNVAKGLNLDDYDNEGDAGFDDTESGEWYISHVKAAVDSEVITGYPDQTFRPGRIVIRAEFAAMITRALDIELEGACEENLVTDIDAEAYWGEAACFLTGNELIDLEDDNFNPLAPMTREDIARMIYAAKDLL